MGESIGDILKSKSKKWSNWRPFCPPEDLKNLTVSEGPGVYQLKNRVTGELVLFGIAGCLDERMKSLMPSPYGSGTRKNAEKREYVIQNWQEIDFRVRLTDTREEAGRIEKQI